VGRRKTMYDIWLLQVVDTADGMINLVSLTALRIENLHVLYVIGKQNTSVLRSGNIAVTMIRKVIVIRVETGTDLF
jgi:hypothetical protein